MNLRLWMLIGLAALVVGCAAKTKGTDYVIMKDGQWVKPVAPGEGTIEGELSLIRKRIEDGDEGKAVDAVEKFLARYGDSPACEEAFMLAGQAEMNRERYYQAFEWYEQQLARYPNGEYYERALHREYEAADAFLLGKKRLVAKVLWMPAQADGLEILSRVAEHAPGSAIAEKALLRIADYHLWKKDYADAAQAYDHYYNLFPKADKAPFAMLRAARSMYASYRGVDYDETPLIDAEQRFRQFRQRYPITADQEGASEVLKVIHAARGQRVYAAGQFYERTRRPQAAAHYYKLVLEGYPDTEWAARARGDLARLGGGKTIQPAELILTPSGLATRPGEPASVPATQAAPAKPEAGVSP